MLKQTIIVVLCTIAFIGYVSGHGMMLEPVGRASRWRYDSSAPANYEDNQMWCGGLGNQHHSNGGRCGLCGDSFNLATPRPHEHGGRFGQGVIVASYQSGSVIRAGVMLTTNHRGHFVFNVCNMDNGAESDQCYQANPLRLTNGASRYELTDFRNGMFYVDLQLPAGLTCRHCVLQWTYVAANQWGQCPDGTSGLGCGPQENYRSCADVSITWNRREAFGHLYKNVSPVLVDVQENIDQNLV